VNNPSADTTYNSLDKYAKNLNQLAQSNKLDPVIGRDEEIRPCTCIFYRAEQKIIRF
jgi:ATP-dependent Clp protease ATP-binding subunit ClpB